MEICTTCNHVFVLMYFNVYKKIKARKEESERKKKDVITRLLQEL